MSATLKILSRSLSRMNGVPLSRAYTARRAERVQAVEAAEQHEHEISRQRLHEQMLAQLRRTDRVRETNVPIVLCGRSQM